VQEIRERAVTYPKIVCGGRPRLSGRSLRAAPACASAHIIAVLRRQANLIPKIQIGEAPKRAGAF
jgi:hypothetical protein